MKLSTIITDKQQARYYFNMMTTIVLDHNGFSILFGTETNKDKIFDSLMMHPPSAIGKWIRHSAAIFADNTPKEHAVERALAIDMLTSQWHEWLESLSVLESGSEEQPMTPTECTSPEDKEMEVDVQMSRLAIGHVISEYLRENNVTITTLAEAAGISREQVGWLMTGKRDPRISTILKVMAAMGYGLMFEREK